MGKDKVKHRKPLLKQFLFSYIMVMICSIISSFILLTVFYSSYHFFSSKNDDINNSKLANVIEFVSKHGSSIEEEKVKQQLSELLKSNNIDCLVKANDGTIVFDFENNQYNLSLISRNTSSIEIPVTNEYGKAIYLFVLSDSKTTVWLMLLCVDVGIPFGCFLVYTYIFARRLNRRISTPLKELMGSVAKIKEHDLDFSVQYTGQENEIGDLVQALEEMRRELKDSLFAQWRLEQDRRDMVNAITHDIRTPLELFKVMRKVCRRA